jgi:hypothetical protein
MRWPAFLLIGSIAALAACSKPAPKTPEAPPSHKSVAAFLGRPHPKPGLWRTSIDADAGPGVRMTGELCLDESTEDAAFSGAPRWSKGDCQKVAFSPGPGGGVAFTTTCLAKGRTVTSQGVATGDFNSSYAMDVTTKVDPPIHGALGQMHTRIQATWTGPCRTGQRPGQLSMKFSGLG